MVQRVAEWRVVQLVLQHVSGARDFRVALHKKPPGVDYSPGFFHSCQGILKKARIGIVHANGKIVFFAKSVNWLHGDESHKINSVKKKT